MTRRAMGLGLVLVVLGATLVLGLWTKARCTDSARWGGQQYTDFCYTDIIPLYGAEQLKGDRLPYLDPCVPIRDQACDEYPVLTMYAMRAASWLSQDAASFFLTNALFLTLAAIAVAWLLFRMVGERALFFAAAPTLIVYAFINWDLLAVAAATAATFAFLRRRDVAAGALLAVGAAAKLYPAIFVLPFALQRWREGDRGGAARIAGVAAATWTAINLPFALAAPEGWSTFFRFSSKRPADWDSLWYAACERVDVACLEGSTLNAAVAVTLVASVCLVWWLKRRREPEFERWTLVFPFLVLFLVTGKVYSPQFSLWLLPLFALILPDVRLFVGFSIAEIAVFLTRFSMFAYLGGGEGATMEQFHAAILVRDLVLIACVVVWVRRRGVAAGLASTAPLPNGG